MKKIGYPCQNWSEKLTTGHSFKLKSYSEEKLKEVVASNIADLKKMLAYNIKNKISFLRISSGFVPFASHPICKFRRPRHVLNNNYSTIPFTKFHAEGHAFRFGNINYPYCVKLFYLLRALRLPIILPL